MVQTLASLSLGLSTSVINPCLFHRPLVSQFSSSVVSDSLRPQGLQHARPPCPLPTPRVYSKSLSRWCRPIISSSVIPFSSCLQSFPASWSFQMSQLFTLGGQSIGVSASASVLSMNIQDWSPLGLSGLISLQSKSVLQHHSSKPSIFWCSHPYMTTGKTIAFTSWKRPWYWERLKAGGEGDDRGWDGWVVSLTLRTWVWVSSRSALWTGRPVMLQSMQLQRVGHDWTELKRTKLFINLEMNDKQYFNLKRKDSVKE